MTVKNLSFKQIKTCCSPKNIKNREILRKNKRAEDLSKNWESLVKSESGWVWISVEFQPVWVGVDEYGNFWLEWIDCE